MGFKLETFIFPSLRHNIVFFFKGVGLGWKVLCGLGEVWNKWCWSCVCAVACFLFIWYNMCCVKFVSVCLCLFGFVSLCRVIGFVLNKQCLRMASNVLFSTCGCVSEQNRSLQTNESLTTLPETIIAPDVFRRTPKGKDCLPTNIFQRRTLS